jgi:hypothetical protein
MLEPTTLPADPPPVHRWWPDIPWERGPAHAATSADRP